MWLELRVWWYAKGYGNSEKMPRDVREYIIRRNMMPMIARLKTREEKDKFASRLMEGALGLTNDEISSELRDTMIKAAFDLTEPSGPLPLPKGPYPSSKPTDSQE